MRADTHRDGQGFKIRVAGRAAPGDMGADQYLARCIHAEIKRRGNQTRAVLTFRCENGRWDGVLLTGWFAIYENLAAHHKFARAYSVAIGRELEVDEELSLDAFVGKLFVVQAGFRKTSGKKFAVEDSTKRKDARDFLRVHELVSLADSATAACANSNEQVTRSRRAARVQPLKPRRARAAQREEEYE